MANNIRGEVPFIANGSTYTLALSMNAICDLQARTKKTYGQLVTDMAALDIIALRDVLYMTLQKHHAADFKTPQAVGVIVDEAGGPSAAVDALNLLFKENQRKDAEATGENP